MFKKCIFAVCLMTTLVATAVPAPAYAAAPPLPNSIAATGDSITRAKDATASCFLTDCPQVSWSTGTSSSVNSQYLRILASNPALAGHAYNIARSGAKIVELANQLATAGYYKIDYVTVLMGGNDLCSPTAATMTPTETFATQFQAALSNYFYYNPGGHAFVSSIPDLYNLWSILHTNSSAAAIWNLFKVCQSMLAAGNTEADRQKVVARENLYNYVLGYVCKTFPNCRWDNYSTFGTKFSASEVSTIDYFHPSVAGQARLAAATWSAGYWGG